MTGRSKMHCQMLASSRLCMGRADWMHKLNSTGSTKQPWCPLTAQHHIRRHCVLHLCNGVTMRTSPGASQVPFPACERLNTAAAAYASSQPGRTYYQDLIAAHRAAGLLTEAPGSRKTPTLDLHFLMGLRLQAPPCQQTGTA